MALPEYDRVLFRKAPLAMVIGQVRYPILPRFSDGTFIASFQESLEADYPAVSREHKMVIQVSVGEETQKGPSEVLWRFATRDRRWSVVLGETAVTLEVPGYSSIDEFLDRFSRVLTVAQETLRITERARLGLRYVNEIRHPQGNTLADWAALLRPDLLGLGASDLLDGRTEHMAQELRIQRPDGTLAIRHGLLTGTGSLVPQPDSPPPISERFYLIDLDFYDPTECDLDVAATVNQMRAYNDLMYRFFRWTLGEQLYNYLEPVDAE